jgi:hypothetical protein
MGGTHVKECQMPGLAYWEAIAGADSGRAVVLGADAPGIRGRARFEQLSAGVGSRYCFLQTKLPPARVSHRTRAEAHVGRWIDEIRKDQHPVIAVLGYCVGSVYAAAIAAGIARQQPMPKLILFDPQFASGKYLTPEFLREVDAIISLLAAQEAEHTVRLAAGIYRPTACDLASAAAEMAGIYWERGLLALEQARLGGAYSARFTGLFDSRASWVPAQKIEPGSVWKSTTVILSSDYGRAAPVNGPGRDGGALGEQLRFDVAHDDLLRSDSVAHAVAKLLESD